VRAGGIGEEDSVRAGGFGGDVEITTASQWIVDEPATRTAGGFDVNAMNIVEEPAHAFDRRKPSAAERDEHTVGPPGSVASSYLTRGSRRPLGVATDAAAQEGAKDVSRRDHVADFNLTPKQLKAHLGKTPHANLQPDDPPL